MNYFLSALYLMLLLDAVLSSLPAPVNVSIESVNFHHVLRWDPGPGTPPGTRYKIFKKVNKNVRVQRCAGTNTRCKLKLDNNKYYRIYVQAVYNQILSPNSTEILFTPYKDTTIGPPKVSLAGCGTCINVNISMPEADKKSKIPDIQEMYKCPFRVMWHKSGGAMETLTTESKSFTLENLEAGMEYCVQVTAHISSTINKNTKPSAWMCTYSSVVEPRRVPVVVSTVAALLVVVGVFLMTLMIILFYAGFLCNLNAALPRALLVLMQGYILTPERTIPDLVSISSELNDQRKRRNPTVSQQANMGENLGEEDEEEEKEEGENAYMNRNAVLSSGTSSSQKSCDNSGTSKPTVSGNSGSLSARCSAEVEVLDAEIGVEVGHRGLDEDEAKDEGAEFAFVSDEDQTRIKGHIQSEEEEEEIKKEEEADNSVNVNLFSVTLGSLERDKGDEEEEEEEEEEQNTRDSLTDFLKLSDQELLLPTDSQRTWSHTEPQNETQLDVVAPVALTQPENDFRECGDEGRDDSHTFSGCLEAPVDEDEEEEEEEVSGYMGRT
ncbi:hypothetical protein LDENG_00212110 [Lucifuga dentata]|nr:hypothetical protein LDENG_00212110 [Lucifuga dentata]